MTIFVRMFTVLNHTLDRPIEISTIVFMRTKEVPPEAESIAAYNGVSIDGVYHDLPVAEFFTKFSSLLEEKGWETTHKDIVTCACDVFERRDIILLPKLITENLQEITSNEDDPRHALVHLAALMRDSNIFIGLRIAIPYRPTNSAKYCVVLDKTMFEMGTAKKLLNLFTDFDFLDYPLYSTLNDIVHTDPAFKRADGSPGTLLVARCDDLGSAYYLNPTIETEFVVSIVPYDPDVLVDHYVSPAWPRS